MRRQHHPVRLPNSPLCGERVGINQMGPGSNGIADLKSLVCVAGACASYNDRGRRPLWKGGARSFLGSGSPRSLVALVVCSGRRSSSTNLLACWGHERAAGMGHYGVPYWCGKKKNMIQSSVLTAPPQCHAPTNHQNHASGGNWSQMDVTNTPGRQF